MKKLYRILFDHYSQKDSKRGIVTHVIADSDEQIYEWLKSEPELGSGKYEPCISGKLYTSWADEEHDEDVNEVDVPFKERVIQCKGRMFDEYYEPADLYYGATEYGWEWISDISDELCNQLIELKIAIKIYNHEQKTSTIERERVEY